MAVVDSGYANTHKLKVGKKVSIAGHSFTVIGIVTQPQGGAPPDVYIPLARAQALGTNPTTGKSLKNDVNTIYVTAASAADIAAVQAEIKNLLPKDTVTTAASLASEVTGSASSAAKLANDLGKWLSILVLIAAFAVASLLTMAAVARRVREFGTLKALGWRSSRIIAQVIGESVAIGIVGGAVGVGLGFAGAAIITSVAPKLTAVLPTATGQRIRAAGGGGGPAELHPHRDPHGRRADVRLGHRGRDRRGGAARDRRGPARRIVRRLADRPAAAGRRADPGGMNRTGTDRQEANPCTS